MCNTKTLGTLTLALIFTLSACADMTRSSAGAHGGASAGAPATAGSSAGGATAGGASTSGGGGLGGANSGSAGIAGTSAGGVSAGGDSNVPNTPPPTLEELGLTKCEHTGSGTEYNVGPGQEYAAIGDVPISDLGPGDTVRIHWREEPYRETLLISAQGSAEDPVRICGVRGPIGERPVISGEGATTPQSTGQQAMWNDLALVLFMRKPTDDWETYYPHDIILEGLDLQGAHIGVPFTNVDGEASEWYNGSACISILRGKNITIRDNEISDCGFGIFAKSTDLDSEQVTNVLIEGNYVHSNNPQVEVGVHNVYVQAFGAVYQFNHFGPPLGADNIKDRSTGTVIRYNWIEPAGDINIDLVEAEEHKLTAVQDPAYRTALVYGNLIQQVFGSVPLHYGADHLELENVPYFRKGTLYFYNNTLTMADPEYDLEPWSRGMMRVTTVEERVEVFNNILDYRGNAVLFELMSFNEPFSHFEQGGHVVIGTNFIRGDWVRNYKDEQPDVAAQMILGADGELGILEGTENFVHTPDEPVDLETMQPAAELRDLASAIPDELVRAGHSVDYQYDVTIGDPRQPLTQIKRRTVVGEGSALGAVEEE